MVRGAVTQPEPRCFMPAVGLATLAFAAAYPWQPCYASEPVYLEPGSAITQNFSKLMELIQTSQRWCHACGQRGGAARWLFSYVPE